MSSDELASCGCVPANTQGDAAGALISGRSPNNTRSIQITNYICPLGSAGVYIVVVTNGIAAAVYH